jgi:hypothetical protein
MLYCPSCFTEYRAGATSCADCGAALLDGEPRYCPFCRAQVLPDAERCLKCAAALVEDIARRCAACDEQVLPSDTFCNHCGSPQPREGATPECDRHPDAPAVGGCVVCGAPLCAECAVQVGDRYFCAADSHVDLYERYAVVYTTSTDYEADMIKANLQGAGIDALVFNQHDHVYFITMGSLAIVNVMVPKDQFARAKDIIPLILEGRPLTDETAGGGEEQG